MLARQQCKSSIWQVLGYISECASKEVKKNSGSPDFQY